MKNFFLLLFVIVLPVSALQGQTTDVVILDKDQRERLFRLSKENQQVRERCDSVLLLAGAALQIAPRPIQRLYYEGLLNNNPQRLDTQTSLEDIDAVVSLIYASYISNKPSYANKAVNFVLAWAKKYIPTGNPINENKFVPLFWAYYLFYDRFSIDERKLVEQWMRDIVSAEQAREYTPNNNWQTKRLRMIGMIGCVLGDEQMKQFAIAGFKEYINTACFADGTSNDLKQRDALSYHIGGIKPMLTIVINLKPFDSAFDLYDYVGSNGSSIKKSLEYIVPYATGEKVRKEWVNTTVQIDKDRAAAGLADYQPGKLFDPREAIEAFEWGCYFDRKWYALLSANGNYTSTWVGLLNSPLIRGE
ncbi:MAG: hypothetical protein HC819_16910 [Cyclobacteriaceae bacterium]|nr:hypothetical protein [Cyclobacteriaceae bacterium]